MAASLRRPGNRRRAETRRTFGRNLRRACAARDIDAAKLAELTGRSRASIERMLAGQGDPTLSFIRRAVQALDVPFIELLRDL